MKVEVPSRQAIKLSLVNIGLTEVQAQLEKDFSLSGLEYPASLRELNASEFLAKIDSFFKKLIRTNPAGFFKLLYRIDIPEDIVRASFFYSASPQVQALTLLIIHRTIVKIRSRQQFGL
jgi:hypothetical protein